MLKNIGEKVSNSIVHGATTVRSFPLFRRVVDLIQSRSAKEWCGVVADRYRGMRSWIADKGEIAFIGGAVGGVVLVVFFRVILNLFAILLALGALWLFIADLKRR